MKKIKLQKNIFIIIALIPFCLKSNIYRSASSICLQKSSSTDIKNILSKFNIDFSEKKIKKEEEKLCIITDINSTNQENFPKFYIVYQNKKLNDADITQSFLNKLNNAIAVWDTNKENIKKYKDHTNNYYYLPQDYKYTDPVVLPCLLPTEALPIYSDILKRSNKLNNDISSHLPTIFVHSYLSNPKIIFELGVASGQSTYPFLSASRLRKSKLIGVEINKSCKKTYDQYDYQDILFLGMDDLLFASKYSTYTANQNPDIIFIDTSHEYNHTVKELKAFEPILNNNGMFIFHDTNMSPLKNFGWKCINGTICYKGWNNEKGVCRALKEHFEIEFNESEYLNSIFTKSNKTWQIIHYPFCNGLTILKKLD